MPHKIKLNIGGPETIPSSPQPGSGTITPETTDQTSTRTFKLNIGGSGTSTSSSTPPPAIKPISAPASMKPPTKSSSASATPLSKSAKEFNFTSDKSHKDADTVLNDTIAAADQDTLNDLYGEGNIIDPNGSYKS